MKKDKEEIQDNQEIQIVVFELANEMYGIEIPDVHEIIRMQEITELPRTPEFIKGVINLRGRIIPVIDLRERFGVLCSDYTKATRIIVSEVSNQMIGMIVDGVSEVLQIPIESIEPPPMVSSTVESEYLSGIAKFNDRLIIMIDLEKVLSKKERLSLGKVSAEALKSGKEESIDVN